MAAADRAVTVVIGADGTGTARFRVSDGLSTWRVLQVSVELQAAPSGATCEVRKNGNLVTPIIPTMDTAADEPAVQLRGTDELTVTWSGCTPGQVGQVTFYYDDGQV